MRWLFNRKGQSIVEITLITPLILVALYVPFDFGVAIFTGHITQNTVRDGARIASNTDSLDTPGANALATQFYANLPVNLVTGPSATKQVTVKYWGSGAPGCTQYVEVSAQGTYNYFFYRLINLLGFNAPSGIKITRTTQLRYERQPDINGGAKCATLTADGIR
jgi:Flp pilus assembly protein TadG